MNRLTNARIERAIRRAEEGSSGHIVVRIVPEKDVDAFARAREEFELAGLHAASERNTAMVLVAPIAHTYAVLGDRELHARVGDAFWRDLASEMQPYFAKKQIGSGIVYAVERIGRELKAHFPSAKA